MKLILFRLKLPCRNSTGSLKGKDHLGEKRHLLQKMMSIPSRIFFILLDKVFFISSYMNPQRRIFSML